jgi:flagellar motor switch protein FliM
MTLHQFLNLKPGDIIPTPKRVNEELLLEIDSQPKFMGQAGVFGKFSAFQIKRSAGPADVI